MKKLTPKQIRTNPYLIGLVNRYRGLAEFSPTLKAVLKVIDHDSKKYAT